MATAPEAPHPTPLRATYRLQLHAGFTLDAAADVADYLAALGVSHAYTSPILQAAPGSPHGYDVTDPGRIDEERGGRPACERFWAALARHGLSQVMDVVPNHMSTATPANRWWWDVLARGRKSAFAYLFDVDWEGDAGGRERVVVPLLGEPLEEALRSGALRVERAPSGEPWLAYHEHRLPLRGVPPGAVGPEAPGPEALRALLDAQAYRLCHWREALRALNYRRFFDVHTLVGLRMVDPRVFDATHAVVLEAVRAGHVGGLRIDHPDGLRDPAGYLERLAAEAPGTWVVVEKILEPGEALRADWPVAGSTGYDFLALVGGLFVDPAGEAPLQALYERFVGRAERYTDVVTEAKRQVLRELFRPERTRLERELDAAVDGLAGAPEPGTLHAALEELLVRFPVYRSYVRPAEGRVAAADVRSVEAAADAARRQSPSLARALDLLVELLLLRHPRSPRAAEFVTRFQQTTGPLMAKGVEDTAFYAFARFVALNEVGADPSRFGTSPREFHAACERRQREWPQSMLTTSTHDTKRSEDVRARLFLLSEIPARWSEAVARWREHNDPQWAGSQPDRSLELLLYQSLVGAHPLPLERALPYVRKAMREAKLGTSWIDPDPAFERAAERFVRGVLGDASFRRELDAFARPLVAPGRVNALAQTLVKLTAPGVPDLYQGTELWDLSLVDPDNRRPVDWALRRRLLSRLGERPSPERILADADRGLPKLWTTHRALGLRAHRPGCFGPGAGYRPLWAEGPAADHVLAFVRTGEDGADRAGVVSVVPRLVLGRPAWGDTRLRLPEGRFANRLTGESGLAGEVSVGALLARFPVALLAAE